MIGRRTLVGLAAWWLAGLSAVATTAAGPIQVSTVVADGRVSASFSVPSAFDRDIEEVVKSGLLVTFTFTVELRRPSNVWWDRTLASVTVASSVKFDNLTGVYHVSKHEAGRVVWSERTKDASEMRTWMTAFERVPLATAEPLEPNVDYYVRVRLQTSPRRTFSLWPWAGDAASGRTEFTFIR